MKKSKILTGALALTMLGGAALTTGCSVSDEDGKAWAEQNGYVKAEDYNIDVENDADTSATAAGQGGLNYGDVEWSEELKKAAIKEYLSGDNNNYREMYSVATSYNNRPSIANVEYVLDTTTFELFGGSEKNTEKLNEMQANPYVSLYWTRQLRETDVTKSYFQSYGVQIEGTVKFYDYANLTGAERTKFIATARNYFETMGAQYAKFYDVNNANYMSDDAVITYFTTSGTVYYSIVPSKIVITSPYLLFTTYVNDDFNIGGHANEFLNKEFLTSLLTYLRTAKNDNTIVALNAIFAGGSGLKTQTTLTFGE